MGPMEYKEWQVPEEQIDKTSTVLIQSAMVALTSSRSGCARRGRISGKDFCGCHASSVGSYETCLETVMRGKH